MVQYASITQILDCSWWQPILGESKLLVFNILGRNKKIPSICGQKSNILIWLEHCVWNLERTSPPHHVCEAPAPIRMDQVGSNCLAEQYYFFVAKAHWIANVDGVP